jgi:flagellar basal-body rod protein FlgB
MFDRLSAALNFYSQALALRGQRNDVLASNIANADTPGYQARDFDFKTALNATLAGKSEPNADGLALTRTAPRHIAGHGPADVAGLKLAYRVPYQPSLDGNTVDMNVARVAFMNNAIHYEADLQLLGDQIKDLKAAMQPAQ